MIFNYIKIAYRNLLRRKGFTLINIVGLSIGVASCLLLFVVVTRELSYDRFQENYDRIYRVVTVEKAEVENFTTGVPAPGLETFRLKFPDAVVAGVYSSYGSQVAVLGNDTAKTKAPKKFNEERGIYFAEPETFKIFSAKFLAGSPQKLGEPGQVVLSRSQAVKYFGDWQQAPGQFLRLDLSILLQVAGVIEDLPANSDFPFKMLVSYKELIRNGNKYSYSLDWGNINSNCQIYMLIPGKSYVAQVERGLQEVSREKYQQRSNDSKSTHVLQPLSEIHFDNRFGTFSERTVSRPVLWTLSLIGVMIILMACINFVNLSTAQSIGRSKEVGLRKVLGGSRRQLMGQFMGETSIIVVAAVLLGAALAFFMSPALQEFMGTEQAVTIFQPWTYIFLALLIPVVILLAGFYPALVLSGFKPALALKNRVASAQVGGISLRRALVVIQFALSQLLLIGTIVAVGQMDFVRNADIGLNKEAVFVLRHKADSVSVSRLPVLRNELLSIPGVANVSFASDVPSSEGNWTTNFAFDGREDEKFGVYLKAADVHYLQTYGIRLRAGRNFVESDTASEFIINETLARKLGFTDPADAVGKNLRLGRGNWMPVVGVVRDFNNNPLRESVKPLLLFSRDRFYSTAGIKLNGKNFTATVNDIQQAWNRIYPEYANSSTFLDESIARFYTQEEQLSKLYKFFAILAIVISCLGLYGLISFMTAQKTREVGVRKVLGASTASIVMMFSREFMVLIILAFLIAAPLGWMIMNKWLENFVFRIGIGPGVFIIAVIATLVVAWLSVGFKAFNAARVNPVKSLKTE